MVSRTITLANNKKKLFTQLDNNSVGMSDDMPDSPLLPDPVAVRVIDGKLERVVDSHEKVPKVMMHPNVTLAEKLRQ